MIQISQHARQAMEDDGISEEEVKACLEYGQLEIKQLVNGEPRYGKKLVCKEKTMVVIYTDREDVIRVITTYLIRRKKWQ